MRLSERKRKRIRLPAAAYLAPGSVWHVTITAAERWAHVFAHDALAADILALIIERCDGTEAQLDLACLMPDHLHLLRVGDVSLVDFIGRIKSQTTRTWWTHGGAGVLWQRSFPDHGVRGPSDYEATVAYLLHNPVKAGIVVDWEDYPWLIGSIISR